MTTLPTDKDDRLEILIDQVGRLTEAQTEFKYEMIDRLDRLIQMSERQAATAERYAATAERHEENITRLVAVVERQAQIVDTLIQGRQQ